MEPNATSSLASSFTTPITQLNPDLSDIPTRSVTGEVTVTWPYSSLKPAFAFLLADHDVLRRRNRGCVKVQLSGPSAKAVAETGVGAGDTVTLILEGAKFEKDDELARVPGSKIEWKLVYAGRLQAEVKLEETDETKVINIDEVVTVEEGIAPHTSIPASPPQASYTTDLYERTPSPPPRPAKRLDVNEYASPALFKRHRISYGVLWESELDEDELEPDGGRKGRGRKRPRYSVEGGMWKIRGDSPSPEPEVEFVEQESVLGKVAAQAETPKKLQSGDTAHSTSATPVKMTDEGVQTEDTNEPIKIATPRKQASPRLSGSQPAATTTTNQTPKPMQGDTTAPSSMSRSNSGLLSSRWAQPAANTTTSHPARVTPGQDPPPFASSQASGGGLNSSRWAQPTIETPKAPSSTFPQVSPTPAAPPDPSLTSTGLGASRWAQPAQLAQSSFGAKPPLSNGFGGFGGFGAPAATSSFGAPSLSSSVGFSFSHEPASSSQPDLATESPDLHSAAEVFANQVQTDPPLAPGTQVPISTPFATQPDLASWTSVSQTSLSQPLEQMPILPITAEPAVPRDPPTPHGMTNDSPVFDGYIPPQVEDGTRNADEPREDGIEDKAVFDQDVSDEAVKDQQDQFDQEDDGPPSESEVEDYDESQKGDDYDMRNYDRVSDDDDGHGYESEESLADDEMMEETGKGVTDDEADFDEDYEDKGDVVEDQDHFIDDEEQDVDEDDEVAEPPPMLQVVPKTPEVISLLSDSEDEDEAEVEAPMNHEQSASQDVAAPAKAQMTQSQRHFSPVITSSSQPEQASATPQRALGDGTITTSIHGTVDDDGAFGLPRTEGQNSQDLEAEAADHGVDDMEEDTVNGLDEDENDENPNEVGDDDDVKTRSEEELEEQKGVEPASPLWETQAPPVHSLKDLMKESSKAENEVEVSVEDAQVLSSSDAGQAEVNQAVQPVDSPAQPSDLGHSGEAAQTESTHSTAFPNAEQPNFVGELLDFIEHDHSLDAQQPVKVTSQASARSSPDPITTDEVIVATQPTASARGDDSQVEIQQTPRPASSADKLADSQAAQDEQSAVPDTQVAADMPQSRPHSPPQSLPESQEPTSPKRNRRPTRRAREAQAALSSPQQRSLSPAEDLSVQLARGVGGAKTRRRAASNAEDQPLDQPLDSPTKQIYRDLSAQHAAAALASPAAGAGKVNTTTRQQQRSSRTQASATPEPVDVSVKQARAALASPTKKRATRGSPKPPDSQMSVDVDGAASHIGPTDHQVALNSSPVSITFTKSHQRQRSTTQPRGQAASSTNGTTRLPSSSSSSAKQAPSSADLTARLESDLPESIPLSTLRRYLHKAVDVAVVACSPPSAPSRTKARQYVMTVNVIDPSLSSSTFTKGEETQVGVEVQFYRAHIDSLPELKKGDSMLLRGFTAISIPGGNGYALKTTEESAYAVLDGNLDVDGKEDEGDVLPQIKGPPMEVEERELGYLVGLKRWYVAQ